MADLKVIIDGDSKGAQDALRAVGGEIKDVSSLAKFGGAALAALAFSVGRMAVSIIDAQDEIAKLSVRTGLAVETLSAFAVGGELAGSSLSDLATGARTLAKVLVDAERGSATAQRTLDGLGITSTTVEGALREAAETLSRMEDATLRTALAQEAFGRGGLALLPVLADGAAGMDRMTERAQALGLAMSEDGTRAAERFNDAITGLWQTIRGAVQTSVDFFLPALVQVAESVEFVAGILTGRGEEAWRRQQGAIVETIDPLTDMDAALAESGREIALWIAANDRTIPAVKATADATRDATAATAARAAALRDLARAQEEQAAFEQTFLAQMIGGISEQQEQDDRRAEYEIDRARETAEAIREIELAAANERMDLREQELRDTERMRDAEFGLAQGVFAGIGRMADLAYGIVGDAAEGGGARAKAAMKALFAASKAASLAGAIVSTAQAVTNALAVQPPPVGIALAAGVGIAGGLEIATIIGTTIQGLADAGRMPVDALRQAGLNRHSLIAVRNDEAIVDPHGTRDLSAMLSIQRRQMELGAQQGSGGTTVVVAELDGRRMTRGLSPHFARALDDGYDYRRDARVV